MATLNAQTINRLKSQLLTSGLQQKDQPLYQVINQLIDALSGVATNVSTIGGGGGGLLSQSFLTASDETGTLPNSEQEIAGQGISILDMPGRRIIMTSIPPSMGDGGGESEDGSPGPPGQAGVNGLPGPQGANAVSFMYGYDGEDGVDGLPGIPGAQGFSITGPQGIPGFPGFDGEDGIDAFGFPGVNGTNGTNGANGTNGSMGPPGTDGEDGAESPSPLVINIMSNPAIPNPILVAGFDYIAQPWYLWKSVNGNGCNGIGIGNPTVSGANGIEFHSDSFYNAVITSTTLNNAVGHSGVNAVHCTDFPWQVEFVIYTDTTAVTGVRYWFGVMTGIPAADAITTRHMAIRFSTSAGDAGWIGSMADGTTQEVTGSLGTVVAATRYVLKIRYVISPSKACYFSVNGGDEQVLSTRMPATGNMFGIPEGAVTNLVGGAGSARGYAFARLQCYHGSSAR